MCSDTYVLTWLITLINSYLLLIFRYSINQEILVTVLIKGGRGVPGSGLSLCKKKDFELEVGGEGEDTSQHFEGSFGSIRAKLPMWGLEAKTGAKTRIWTKENKA